MSWQHPVNPVPQGAVNCVSPYWVSDSKIWVPCSQCLPCREARVKMWTMRLEHEALYTQSKIFVTLTYNDKSLPKGGLLKRDIQLFLKRVRKEIQPIKIKYFFCGEYGDLNHRPHYHGIIFGLNLSHMTLIEDSWGLGLTDTKIANSGAFKYCCEYLMKDDIVTPKNCRAPFSLKSQGLGKRYALEQTHYIKKHIGIISENGKSKSVPKIYREWLGITGDDVYIKFKEYIDSAQEARHKYILTKVAKGAKYPEHIIVDSELRFSKKRTIESLRQLKMRHDL